MRIVFPYDGYESLGIGYLASRAIQNGYDVALHPLRFGDYIRGYSHPSHKSIIGERDAILSLKPDIVAFSLNSFMAGSLTDLALSVNRSGITTLAGGPHCTAEPVGTVETDAFSGVISGEADDVFVNTIECISQNNFDLPWLFTMSKKNGGHILAENIDDLPFPSKRLFYEINHYESGDYKIVTSRGCPYNCIFCSNSNPSIKKKFRRRSVDNVIAELVSAKKEFNIRSVYFLDDVFTISTEWIRDFMKEYKKRINLPFHAVTHPDHINEEISSSLKGGGCFAIRLGVQTGNEIVKKNVGRDETNQSVIDAVNCLKIKNIKVEIDNMLNLPGESVDEARKNIMFYNNLRPASIKTYWLTPLPGTTWYNQSVEQKLITGEQTVDIRKGRAFGKHSYLFYDKAFHRPDFVGIHLLLSWLPLLPKSIVSFLIKIKADRFLRIPSFLLVVGMPRIINMTGWRDKVGQEHIKRIVSSVKRKLKLRKGKNLNR